MSAQEAAEGTALAACKMVTLGLPSGKVSVATLELLHRMTELMMALVATSFFVASAVEVDVIELVSATHKFMTATVPQPIKLIELVQSSNAALFFRFFGSSPHAITFGKIIRQWQSPAVLFAHLFVAILMMRGGFGADGTAAFMLLKHLREFLRTYPEPPTKPPDRFLLLTLLSWGVGSGHADPFIDFFAQHVQAIVIIVDIMRPTADETGEFDFNEEQAKTIRDVMIPSPLQSSLKIVGKNIIKECAKAKHSSAQRMRGQPADGIPLNPPVSAASASSAPNPSGGTDNASRDTNPLAAHAKPPSVEAPNRTQASASAAVHFSFEPMTGPEVEDMQSEDFEDQDVIALTTATPAAPSGSGDHPILHQLEMGSALTNLQRQCITEMIANLSATLPQVNLMRFRALCPNILTIVSILMFAQGMLDLSLLSSFSPPKRTDFENQLLRCIEAHQMSSPVGGPPLLLDPSITCLWGYYCQLLLLAKIEFDKIRSDAAHIEKQTGPSPFKFQSLNTQYDPLDFHSWSLFTSPFKITCDTAGWLVNQLKRDIEDKLQTYYYLHDDSPFVLDAKNCLTQMLLAAIKDFNTFAIRTKMSVSQMIKNAEFGIVASLWLRTMALAVCSAPTQNAQLIMDLYYESRAKCRTINALRTSTDAQLTVLSLEEKRRLTDKIMDSNKATRPDGKPSTPKVRASGTAQSASSSLAMCFLCFGWHLLSSCPLKMLKGKPDDPKVVEARSVNTPLVIEKTGLAPAEYAKVLKQKHATSGASATQKHVNATPAASAARGPLNGAFSFTSFTSIICCLTLFAFCPIYGCTAVEFSFRHPPIGAVPPCYSCSEQNIQCTHHEQGTAFTSYNFVNSSHRGIGFIISGYGFDGGFGGTFGFHHSVDNQFGSDFERESEVGLEHVLRFPGNPLQQDGSIATGGNRRIEVSRLQTPHGKISVDDMPILFGSTEHCPITDRVRNESIRSSDSEGGERGGDSIGDRYGIGRSQSDRVDADPNLSGRRMHSSGGMEMRITMGGLQGSILLENITDGNIGPVQFNQVGKNVGDTSEEEGETRGSPSHHDLPEGNSRDLESIPFIRTPNEHITSSHQVVHSMVQQTSVPSGETEIHGALDEERCLRLPDVARGETTCRPVENSVAPQAQRISDDLHEECQYALLQHPREKIESCTDLSDPSANRTASYMSVLNSSLRKRISRPPIPGAPMHLSPVPINDPVNIANLAEKEAKAISCKSMLPSLFQSLLRYFICSEYCALLHAAPTERKRVVSPITRAECDYGIQCGIMEEIPFHKAKRFGVFFLVGEVKASGPRNRCVYAPHQLNEEQRASYAFASKLPTIEDVCDMLWLGDYAVQYDLTKSFYQYAIPESCRPYFCFITSDGICMCMKRVPMGCVAAPELLNTTTMILSPSVSGVHSRSYIDNVFAVGQRDRLSIWDAEFIRNARQCGATLNKEVHNAVHQRSVFIGVGYDLKSKAVFIPDKTKKKLTEIKLKLSGSLVRCDIDELASVMGVLLWASRTIGMPLAQHYYPMKFYRKMANIYSMKRNEQFGVWRSVIPHFHRWIDSLIESQDVPVKNRWTQDQWWHLFTDATPSGYGAVLISPCGEVHSVAGKWTPYEKRGDPHINALELRATRYALTAFATLLRDAKLRIHIDNTSALSALLKGNSRSFWLSAELSKLDMSFLTAATVNYIASASNPADEPSRGMPIHLPKLFPALRCITNNCRRRHGGDIVAWSLSYKKDVEAPSLSLKLRGKTRTVGFLPI